jgi:hypothetical protein
MSFLPTSSSGIALVIFFAFFVNIIIVDLVYSANYYGQKDSGDKISWASIIGNILLKHIIPLIFVLIFTFSSGGAPVSTDAA